MMCKHHGRCFWLGKSSSYATRWRRPPIYEALVKERDRHMFENIAKVSGTKRTLAIVGMAHMDGIEREWAKRGGEVYLHEDNTLRKLSLR